MVKKGPTATKAAMKAKALAAAKRAGLNKTEKKQVKKTVENALKKEHILKYFDSESSDDAVAPLPTEETGTNIKKQVSVIGFSSTTEFDAAGATEHYGENEIQPLYLARPFREANTDDALAAQALNGQYAMPKVARAHFSIERVFYRQAIETGDDLPDTAAQTLPICYRIIKVEAKPQTNTQITCEPGDDLFVNAYGQPTGVDQPNFDRLDCRYDQINTKKYKKLMDMQGTIYQNNIMSETSADSTSNRRTDIVTSKVGKSFIHFTVPFQLSARKNGKLYYADPQSPGTKTFTSGGKRQYVFMHFWFENGHGLLGGTHQPDCPKAIDLQIKSKSMSGFVDVQ